MATELPLQYSFCIVLSLICGIRCVLALTETSDSASNQRSQYSPLKFVVEPTGELYVRENSKVIFNCSAIVANNEQISITWRKDGGRIISGLGSSYSSSITDSDAPSHVTVDESGSLVIDGVVKRYASSDLPGHEAGSRADTSSPRDSRRRPAGTSSRGVVGGENAVGGDQGQYECLATHRSYGTIVSTPIQLRIISLASKFSSSPPSGVSTVAGQSVRLQCSIKAVPPVVIRWLKDGKPVMAAGENQHRITILDALGVLQLEHVQTSDIGFYKCVVGAGADIRTNSGTHLTVRNPYPNEHIAATLVHRLPAEMKATVLSAVVVECFVTGLPKPSVVWTRRGQQVSLSVKSRIRVFGSGNLHIDTLLQSDEGLYTCTWTDMVTMVTASATVNITVLAPPQARVKLDAITHRYQGDALRLECAFDGRPTPSVRWLKNGELYVSRDPRIRVENSDRGFSNLVINATTVAEYSGGMYQCRANNTLGVALLTTWVNIELKDDGAKPPADLSVQALSSSSMLVSWKDSPLNSGLIVVAYNIEYFITELGSRRSLGKVAQRGTYKMVIDELQADTNYSVYMVTFATSGRSKPSDVITVVTGIDRSRQPVAVGQNRSMSYSTHSSTTISTYDPNWKPIAVHYNATAMRSHVPLLSDQQLGILIGSCVGMSCIFFSVMLVILRNRFCVRPVVSGHHRGTANGLLPQSRTLICHCHLANNGIHQLQPSVPVPVNERELALQSMERHCDTKGGFTIGGCNGKEKPLSLSSNSQHSLSGKNYPVSDASEHLLSSSPGVDICAVNEETLPLRTGSHHYNEHDLNAIDYDLKHDDDNCNFAANVGQLSDYKKSVEVAPVYDEELPSCSPCPETPVRLTKSREHSVVPS